MSRKVIFLDVDGTLCNDLGLVPESAIRAIKKARDNGHYVFICTGRSKAELYDYILDIGFDGIIGAGGGYIELEGKVIQNEHVKHEDLVSLVDFFNEHDVDFYLESQGGLYGSKNLVPRLEEIFFGNDISKKDKKSGHARFINQMIVGECLYRNDVNKICFLHSALPFSQIEEEFNNRFNVIPCTVPAFGESSGELSVKGIHKATAIELLLTHLFIDKKDTFAIGDGMNDLEMLQYVEIGIAMGNAKDGLKEIADDITDTHDNNGIYNSFLKYGLI